MDLRGSEGAQVRAREESAYRHDSDLICPQPTILSVCRGIDVVIFRILLQLYIEYFRAFRSTKFCR